MSRCLRSPRWIQNDPVNRIHLILCSLQKQPTFFAPANAAWGGSEERGLFSQAKCFVEFTSLTFLCPGDGEKSIRKVSLTTREAK